MSLLKPSLVKTPCPICHSELTLILHWGNGQIYLSIAACKNGHVAVDSDFLQPAPKPKIITPDNHNPS